MQLETYQHITEYINPIIFQIGFFSVRWYSIMYLVGFAVVYFLLKYRLKNDFKIHNTLYIILNTKLPDLLIYLIIGLLVGARLGYVIFYDLNYFIHNPLEIIIPPGVNCQWSSVNCLDSYGIQGMSYFGGLIGTIIAGLIFCKKYKINFWRLADFVVPAVPAGYFFGRIGNFLNGELYGRVTSVPWGMYFPADPYGLLRHPSQLYEAFFEGIVLFAVLWALRNKNTGRWSVASGKLLIVYLFSYGFFRFFIEFFREPDPLRLGSLSEASPQIGLFFGWLSLGQIFSAMAIIIAALTALIGKKLNISQYAKNGL